MIVQLKMSPWTQKPACTADSRSSAFVFNQLGDDAEHHLAGVAYQTYDSVVLALRGCPCLVKVSLVIASIEPHCRSTNKKCDHMRNGKPLFGRKFIHDRCASYEGKYAYMT